MRNITVNHSPQTSSLRPLKRAMETKNSSAIFKFQFLPPDGRRLDTQNDKANGKNVFIPRSLASSVRCVGHRDSTESHDRNGNQIPHKYISLLALTHSH